MVQRLAKSASPVLHARNLSEHGLPPRLIGILSAGPELLEPHLALKSLPLISRAVKHHHSSENLREIVATS